MKKILFFNFFWSMKAQEIVPLETYIRNRDGDQSSSIIADMSRADSLFRLEDTRDLLFAMLHYRYEIQIQK